MKGCAVKRPLFGVAGNDVLRRDFLHKLGETVLGLCYDGHGIDREKGERTNGNAGNFTARRKCRQPGQYFYGVE